jgi:carboxymethylenebutenolidase
MNNVEIGTGLEGFMVKPAGTGPFPAVVVLMEAYGLTGHIQNACRRLADAGFLALAPDLFHGKLIPYNEVQAAMAKIGTLKDEVMLAEIDASLDWFDRQTDVRSDARGIIGFCMGGRLAFLAGCRSGSRLQAVVSFYGGGIAPDGPDRFGRTRPSSRRASWRRRCSWVTVPTMAAYRPRSTRAS